MISKFGRIAEFSLTHILNEQFGQVGRIFRRKLKDFRMRKFGPQARGLRSRLGLMDVLVV